jgi:hypothetical protein
MQIDKKTNTYFVITVICVCIFIYGFILPMPLYAEMKIVCWGYNAMGRWFYCRMGI